MMYVVKQVKNRHQVGRPAPKRALGYSNPTLDAWAQGTITGRPAIRGREQQLYDHYRLKGKHLGNSIRSVDRFNPLAPVYHEASNAAFGNIAPYSGSIPNPF